MRIPEDIRRAFFNRPAAVLAVLFLLFVGVSLLLPAKPPAADAGGLGSYFDEVSRGWEKISARYMNVGFSLPDAAGYAAFALLGICGAYLGIEYAVRRRTDSVIKRHFTHTEDK